MAPGGHPRSGSLVGAVGEDRNAPAFADPDDPVRAGRLRHGAGDALMLVLARPVKVPGPAVP